MNPFFPTWVLHEDAVYCLPGAFLPWILDKDVLSMALHFLCSMEAAFGVFFPMPGKLLCTLTSFHCPTFLSIHSISHRWFSPSLLLLSSFLFLPPPSNFYSNQHISPRTGEVGMPPRALVHLCTRLGQ